MNGGRTEYSVLSTQYSVLSTQPRFQPVTSYSFFPLATNSPRVAASLTFLSELAMSDL
jgi:hypothetical protein